MRILGATAIIAIALVSCSSDSNDSDPAGTTRTYTHSVYPFIVDSCALAACHASGQQNLGIHLSNDFDQVYDELQKTSPTSKMKFVVPGDPVNSYLMAKIDGRQDDFAAKCGGHCGTEMPPGNVLPQKNRDAVRAWIQQGAKKD